MVSLLHNRKVVIVMRKTVAQIPVSATLVSQMAGTVREAQQANPQVGVIVMTVPALIQSLKAGGRDQIGSLTPKELHKVAHAIREKVGARKCSVNRPRGDTRAIHATLRWVL